MKKMKRMRAGGGGASRRLLPAVIIAAVMVLAAAAVLAPDTETDAAPGDYVDYYGNLPPFPAGITNLGAPGHFGGVAPNYELDGGRYYVSAALVDLGPNSTLTIKGAEVTLIIGAGCELKVDLGVTVSATTSFYLYTEDPGVWGIGKLTVTGGNGVTLLCDWNYPFKNTAYINATQATSSGVRYAGGGVGYAEILNGATGIIEGGANGIHVRDTDLSNLGEITGGEIGFKADVFSYVDNYDGGLIFGQVYGITSSDEINVSNYEGGAIKAGAGGVCGIYSVDYGVVYNEGLISGPTGIYLGYFEDTGIRNMETGTIEGFDGDGIVVNDGLYFDIVNNGGYIYGSEIGIVIYEYGTIYNWISPSGVVGVIESGMFDGIYLDAGGAVFNEGEITSGGLTGYCAIRADDISCIVENYGQISGPTGIHAEYMRGGDAINNYETGTIEGFDGDGISVQDGDVGGIEIYNNGGFIWGSSAGIYLGAPGNIYNNVVLGVTGIIGGSDGLFLDAGGMIYNEGEITGINSQTAYTDLTQLGLISGSVWLCTTTSNNVVFGAGSVINSDLIVGGAGSTLFFVKGLGDTSAPTVYATVNGPVALGIATVSVEDIQDLPAGYSGAKVILIDAVGISGAPSNNTISLLAPVITLDLLVENDQQLIAWKLSVPIVVPPLTDYKITASADSGSTISPAGISTVSGGSNKTFTFSAKPGYIISEVKIDNAFSLTQAEVNSGTYTFTNVTADHTIVVKSIAGTASNITLTVIVKEGNGYAEYNTGSGFVKYTGPIALTAGTNVQLRAVADDGFLFDKWETPSVETNSAIAINNIQSSKSVNLYFASEDSGNPSSSNLVLYVGVFILILLVIFVVFFLWKRSKNKG